MIDPELQSQLRQKFNPEGSDLRKMQLRMLDMLKYVDTICRENDIKYWLSSGTCLGAVRHGGFIPWDDDVDIEMLQEDYKRLIRILRQNKDKEFVIQTHEDDYNYILDFAKLRDKSTVVDEMFGVDKLYQHQGLFIDIFCMKPSSSRKLHYLCGRLRVFEIYFKKWSMISDIARILFPIVRFINNVVLYISGIFDNINAGNQLRHVLGVAFLCPRNMEDICRQIRVSFEDTELPIPVGYDSYLSKMYGNYNELRQEHIHIKNNEIKNH